jgi:ribosomal protein S18 acetylase RimI-like enzyme
VIRRATPADLPGLVALDRAVFGDHAYPALVLRQAFDALTVLVAGDPPVGYALASLEAGADDGWIWSLGVQADARGRGIARALLDAVERELAERGAAGVRLHVSPGNGPARRLYERRGYERVDFVADAFGPGEDRLILRLALRRR